MLFNEIHSRMNVLSSLYHVAAMCGFGSVRFGKQVADLSE